MNIDKFDSIKKDINVESNSLNEELLKRQKGDGCCSTKCECAKDSILAENESENENDFTKRDDDLKLALLKRLNRIEGQIRGIKQMIERDEYCDNVLTQISASSSALDSVSKLVLENHLRKCFVEKIRSGDDKIIDDVIKIIGKIL